MKKIILNAVMTICIAALCIPVYALDVPLEVKEQEVAAVYRPDPNLGGGYRPDGSDAWDYCIEDGCHYNPQAGDRIKVDAVQGWRMTFWNVGEMGGELKKTAKLEQVREFLNAGETVTEVLPPLTEDSFKSGITYSKIISTPADDIIEPYINPKYTFTLGFTGGPNGVFYEMGGARQHPNGKEIRGDVVKGADGLYYIKMSGAFNADLKIDDPKVFDGFIKSWDDANIIWEGGYAYGFADYNGEVWVEDNDGEAYSAQDFAAENGRQISSGMTVKTGLNSYAVIVLNNQGARLVVGPNSQVAMKRPELGFFDTKLGMLIFKAGKNIEKIIKTGEMNVTMNQAVAGRKGTVAVFIEEPGISTIKVLEGEMYMTANAGGETKDIRAGSMLSADKSGLGDLKPVNIEEELKEWEKIVPSAVMEDLLQTVYGHEKTNLLLYIIAGTVLAAGALSVYLFLRRRR
ncbi:MAG: hypothetical protein ACOYUZ_02915 [Patescibacteria group bacterium]